MFTNIHDISAVISGRVHDIHECYSWYIHAVNCYPCAVIHCIPALAAFWILFMAFQNAHSTHIHIYTHSHIQRQIQWQKGCLDMHKLRVTGHEASWRIRGVSSHILSYVNPSCPELSMSWLSVHNSRTHSRHFHRNFHLFFLFRESRAYLNVDPEKPFPTCYLNYVTPREQSKGEREKKEWEKEWERKRKRERER